MADIMLDLETMGTRPGCAILSIAAVAFERDGTTGQRLHVRVTPASNAAAGLIGDPETVAWWMRQSDAAREAALSRPIPLQHALWAFTTFVEQVGGMDRPAIWAQGADFDGPVLAAAFRACAMTVPWHFSALRDTRTAYDVLGFNHREVPRAGEHHDALDDCLHQVGCLTMAMAKARTASHG